MMQQPMEHVGAALGGYRRQAAHLQLTSCHLLSLPVIRSQLGSTQITVPGDGMEKASFQIIAV